MASFTCLSSVSTLSVKANLVKWHSINAVMIFIDSRSMIRVSIAFLRKSEGCLHEKISAQALLHFG